MDVRINEVQSTVQLSNSLSALDPRIVKELVRACVKAMKEDQEHEKRMESERKLSTSDDK
jgi:hypothetical protein